MKPCAIRILGVILPLWAAFSASCQISEKVPLVSYSSREQSLMSGIATISLETHVPIGVVLGADYARLCQTRRTFAIVNSTPGDALEQIGRLAGYSVRSEDGVFLLLPSDLPAWESQVMSFRFDTFPKQNASMASLGTTLTGWIQMTIGHVPTFAASIMSSTDVKVYTFNEMKNATISEIADRIVTLPGGGIWVLRPIMPRPASAADLELRVFSYADDREEIQSLDCSPHQSQVPQGQAAP